MPSQIFPLTGEPIGQTQWRRWRGEKGWHPATPDAIKAEYDWLFEPGISASYPDSPEENQRKQRELGDD